MPTPLDYVKLQVGDAKHMGEVAPGIHTFHVVRAMGRVRAYQTNVLSPQAARGSPQESILVGHIHLDTDSMVYLIEGFNGLEGSQFAEKARVVVAAKGFGATNLQVKPTCSLRDCAATGIRPPR